MSNATNPIEAKEAAAQSLAMAALVLARNADHLREVAPAEGARSILVHAVRDVTVAEGARLILGDAIQIPKRMDELVATAGLVGDRPSVDVLCRALDVVGAWIARGDHH